MLIQKPTAAAALAFVSLGFTFAATAAPSFERLGTYTTGLADVANEVTAGETAALRHGRLYVTNAFDVSLDIVNVWNPKAPSLIKRVDLKSYGAKVNSVDVSWWNLIAVAVEPADKTDPGTIVFITPWGTVIGTARVGSLPDMVAFTPDGKKLLVANEGEPNCYADPDDCLEPVDPKGSVSIVTVVPWKSNPPVKTINFEGVVLPADVRIFGPNATPAQDLEPEYITISDDGRTAYVTLQENNAIAEINISAAKVTAIRGLGYKDFNPALSVEMFEVGNLPAVGTTAGGQQIKLGGFSGLFYEGTTNQGKLKFVTHTDRGPNGEPTGVNRPFLLPQFAPRIVRLELDPTTGNVAVTQQIALKRSDGVTPLTGLANTAIGGGNGNTPYNDEVPIDLFGNVLGLDPLGGDFEGIVVDADDSFWLPDEYRPAIYHFDPSGTLIARFIPIGTHAAAGQPVPAPGAAGVFGIEALPAVLGQRRQNRGFEAIAQQNGKLYAFVQSPIRNPATLGNAALNVLKNVRVVEFDPATLATRQFLYVMDQPAAAGNDSAADKLGDAAALPGGGFLVVERDDDAAPEDPVNTITKRIYEFNLTGATEITPKDTLYDIGGVLKSLDQMSAAELALPAVNVKPVAKVLHVDLATTDYNIVEKVEGLALIDANTIAVINDNDFRVAGISIDNTTGTFTLLPTYSPEPVVLGLIATPGLDASDQDNVINIRRWPVYGMYQPDGIASYSAGGQRFLVTANEGDARDYDGFAEDVRARSIRDLFPGLPEVADNQQLGRLTITNTPPLADFSRPYVFGTRSFSIWNAATGAQVWDSGSDLEVLTAAAFPGNFNSDNAGNNFDNRSDNKGPEPEGVDIGKISGRSFAFVALERIGGVVVYDVTNPANPEFVEYLLDRDFSADPPGPDSGPEVVHFINALESPNGKPMLVVANEVSGTVSLWGLSNVRPWWRQHPWRRVWHPRRHF